MKIDWHYYGVLMQMLVQRTAAMDVRFTDIIAVSRGGLQVGVALSHAYPSARFHIWELNSYVGRTRTNMNIGRAGRIITEGRQQVLVADDIMDSGETYKAICNLIEHQRMRAPLPETHEVQAYAAVLVAQNLLRADPDVIAASYKPSGVWVEFPWEVEAVQA